MVDASMHLYFIGAEGLDFIKVGRSKNPAKRLQALRTASPYKLRLLRTYEGRGDLEPYVLQLLRERMDVNGEWFLGREVNFDELVGEATEVEAVPIDPSPPVTLGAAIVRARHAQHYTQADLVKATGLSQKYISEIENGHVDPRISIVLRIAKALQVSVDALADGKIP